MKNSTASHSLSTPGDPIKTEAIYYAKYKLNYSLI